MVDPSGADALKPDPGEPARRALSEQAFERYAERVLPGYLKPGSPTPRTWTLGDATWQRFCDASRKWCRLKAMFEFTSKIADGFWLDEVSSGELAPGAEMGALTGRPHRQPVSETPNGLRDYASDLQKRLHKAGVKLDTILTVKLDHVVGGFLTRAEAELVVSTAEAELTKAKQPA